LHVDERNREGEEIFRERKRDWWGERKRAREKRREKERSIERGGGGGRGYVYTCSREICLHMLYM